MSEIAEQTFIHFHIPKTAGTSIRASFVEHFGDEKVSLMLPDGKHIKMSDLPFKVEQVDRMRRITRKIGLFNLYTRGLGAMNRNSTNNSFDLSDIEAQGLSVATGHFKAEHITESTAHIPRTTIVRDPLERAWSHYVYWRDSKGASWWHDGTVPYSDEVSFEEFASDPNMVNYQTRYLGGLHFDVVGVSNNMPVFFEEIGMSNQSYLPVLNPGRYREIPTMEQGFLREFEDANRADYELHEIAAQRR